MPKRGWQVVAVLVTALVATACGQPQPTTRDAETEMTAPSSSSATSPAETITARTSASSAPRISASRAAARNAAVKTLPRPGTRIGRVSVPKEGRADTSRSTRVVGRGTPGSCTSAAVVAAVAKGGVIRFSCGPRPVTITLKKTAKIRNGASRTVVLDGGGMVTLSGGGKRRILYMNTCDKAQGWTTSHCNDQDSPRLTVQNLTFADGNSAGQHTDGGGGGAIFVRGGRFKVVQSRFVRNRCDRTGPDLGGAAIRVLDQHRDRPVYVVNSTFGGAKGKGGVCSNGGALSSIGVSWVVLNTVISHNSAVGRGANPARSGTPGGGSGGGIYADGNRFTMKLAGSRVENNSAREGGGAVFFVSNDRTGSMAIEKSVLRRNTNQGFHTAGFPGIFFLGAGSPAVKTSQLS